MMGAEPPSGTASICRRTALGVALGLVLVRMAACHLPARRVLKIDPAQSLRQE